VVVLGAVAAGLAWRWRPLPVDPSLPPFPDLSRQPPALAEHLQERFDQARRTRNAATRAALCTAYHADMFYEQADACYASMRDADPGNWRWSYARALIGAERGGGAALVMALRQVVAMQPGFAPAWLRLGDASFTLGDYDAAADAWRHAAALPEPPRATASPPHVPEAPAAAYASLGLARLALARGDADNARAILEQIVAKAPGFGAAWRLIAETYADPQSTAAVAAQHRADRLPASAPYADPFVDDLARESRNSRFLLRLSAAAGPGANAAWSEFLARRALEFDPDSPDAIARLGQLLRSLGRNEDALQYLQQYNALVPGDYRGLALTGGCLTALGRYGEAEPLLRRALPHVDDGPTHYNLAQLLSQTNRLDAAVIEYRTALARDPAMTDARMNLAAVLVQRGDLDAAAQELRHVILDDPDHAPAHADLGLLRARQGQRAEAIAELRLAVSIDPSLTDAANALRLLETR
jgi:tetratricopeptide (TPR) repeat protein